MYYLSFMQLLEYYNFDKAKCIYIAFIQLAICIILIIIEHILKKSKIKDIYK